MTETNVAEASDRSTPENKLGQAIKRIDAGLQLQHLEDLVEGMSLVWPRHQDDGDLTAAVQLSRGIRNNIQEARRYYDLGQERVGDLRFATAVEQLGRAWLYLRAWRRKNFGELYYRGELPGVHVGDDHAV